MMSITNCMSLSLAFLCLCLILSADQFVRANENDAESITKIGQGMGHIMNIYYWYVFENCLHNTCIVTRFIN